MVIISGLVWVSSLIVNLLCRLIVPVVESIAYKLRLGEGCECPSPLSSPSPSPTERGRRHKKLKNSSSVNGVSRHHHFNHDVKRIKLLLDITVAKNGSRVLDIQASTAKGIDECKKNPGLILTFLNLPSSVMLWFMSKLRQLAHELETLKHPSCDNPNRIKKSPKRRIRANYHKIIPFFPFNLLGFSNYSAFQMPSITRSSSSATATAEETNNLNVSGVSMNGKTRCKRRRNSSTDEDASLSPSDEDISFLEMPEKSSSAKLTEGEAVPPVDGGHDEVDSDETGDTVAKVATSSSSSDNNNPLLHKNHPHTATNDDSKKISVVLNTSTSEDNGGGGNVTTMTDLDSSSGVVGEEHQVRFSFIEELNEAANESYNSLDDPDYVPLTSCTSTSDSSFATDKGCSDESLLLENGATNGTDADQEDKKDTSTVVEKPEVEKSQEEEKLKAYGTQTTSNGKQASPSTPSQTLSSPSQTSSAPTQTSSVSNDGAKKNTKKNKKNKKQNGTSNYHHPPPNNLEPFSTGNEDDYKTPEEGENDGHPF